MDQFSKLGPVQALIKFWGTLNNTQRFVTAVFISTSVVLLVVVAVVATRPSMAVLFTGLQPQDAGAIIAKLQENKIPYQIDGTTIKIPEKNVDEMRMQLASQGLPESSNVGFEIFDKTNLGMTDFSQRMSYQRALQGELCRAIDQIESVSKSKVIIALPKESVFAGEEKQPTASVTLKLRQGGKLNGDQVAGIVRLVSSSVEGLKPEHITVVDTDGNMLNEPSDDATGLDPRMSSSQLRLKKEYERQVQQDIQSMLERVLGENKAVVRVCAKINFDHTEQSKELYEPVASGANQAGSTGVMSSETKMQESYGGAGGAGSASGVPGVAANRPGAQPVVTMSSRTGNGYQRVEANTKYEVSKTTEHTIVAPGQVDKLSVAVMLDKKVEQSKVPQIQDVIAAAAGIDPNRGDQITVMSMAFDDSAAKQEAKEMQSVASRSTMMSMAKTVSGVLLLFGFLFFLKGMLKQIKVQVPEPTTVEEISVDEPLPPLPGYDSIGQPVAAAVGGSSEPESAPAQPQDVAKALRAWMSES